MKIALYAGSFNPPGMHHCRIVDVLDVLFDLVFIVPCGQCPGKVGIIENKHRVEIIRRAFPEKDRVRVDFSDAINETFVRPYELDAKYRHMGTSWYVIGSDMIIGGAHDNSSIHRNWKNGGKLWHELNFAIITRPDHTPQNDDFPPKHMLIETNFHGSSTKIRGSIALKNDLVGLMPVSVAKYIIKHNLYGYQS